MFRNEEKTLTFWRENNIFQKTLEKNKGKKQFIFYEGPPTANAKPGLHHVLARVFKDIILRYKTMRGYYVPRRAGWDTHGLPVEIEIEKKLGIKSKPEIEKFGIAKFNELAKKSVWEYKEDWEKLTERIGFWLDMESPYITYENGYIEKLWGIFKKIDERGLLYKSRKVVPWCPRCGTALSSHELAQGYEEVSDQSVYVKFKLKKGQKKNIEIQKPREVDDKTYILSWTTTAWTLPGNVALAIKADLNYVLVKHEDEKLLIAESLVDKVLGEGLETIGKLKGGRLIDLEYEPLFNIPQLKSTESYKIYAAGFVNTDEGTGVVHTAVMYGEDDYEMGKKAGFPQHHTVDERGRFIEDVPGLAGLYVKDPKTEEKIVNYLKTKKYLLKTEKYTHEYPFCWRCGTAVLYYARDSWFVAMSKLKKELLAANKKINWIPAHLKEGRFGEWLREVKDWAISRERYWGTPLPIWECKMQNPKCKILVVGSIKELEKFGAKTYKDLHRPYIDTVILKCPQCNGEMGRVKEVADVWFDSGAMPFASGEYPKRYPADYICEAVDQTRGWFYTLLAVAVLLDSGAPYRNVISLGHLLDRQGQKMSKSRGNVVEPWDLINRYGADAVRWYFYTVNPPGEPKKFDENDLLKTKRRFHNLLYNSSVFYKTYVSLNSKPHNLKSENILDKWIIARLNEVIVKTTERLDDYDIGGAAKIIESLVDDLSHWYIRRSRKRPETLSVLRYVLLEIAKLIAPFTPFFAEEIYKTLIENSEIGNRESIHLEDWPKVSKKLIDKKSLEQMAETRRLASLALAARAAAGIKVRQPLAELKVKSAKSTVNEELLLILAEEINVKKISFDTAIENEVVLDTAITSELREEGILRDMVRMIQEFRREKKLQPQDTIELRAELPEEMLAVAQKNDERLRREVNATKIAYNKTTKAKSPSFILLRP